MELTQVIKRPLVTEKSMLAQGLSNRYAFEVDAKARKGVIKAAVEQLFKVTVTDVNTLIVRGKIKRVGRSVGQRSTIKKALVTLKSGDKIELFEGV